MSASENISGSGREHPLRALSSPLVSHVVVLDSDGVITWASHSWEEFARRNQGELQKVSVGKNYLDVCRKAAFDEPAAERALEGIRSVISGNRPAFSLEYPCHAPNEERWFVMSVHPMPLGRGVAISHVEITASKLVAPAFRESEERYWLLVEYSPNPIFVHRNGIILHVNRAAADLFGARRRSELTGSPIICFAHPDTLPSIQDRFDDRGIGSRPLPTTEEKLLRLDGQTIFAELTTIPITYLGEPAALSVARDTTERKRLQEELRRRDREIAALVENSPDVIFRLDLQLRCIYVSPAIARNSGIPPEQFVGRSIDEIRIDSYDVADLTARCRDAISTRREVQKEVFWKGRYFRTRIVPQLAPDGAIEWLLGITEDVTERRRAEEAQRQSERQYESLVNSIESIVWEIDYPSYRFTFVSKQAERILGYPVERWINDPEFFVNHIHKDDQWVPEFCRNATERGQDHQFEYRMIAADGSVVWLRDIVTVETIDNRPFRVRGVMIDITESRLAKQERETLHRALEIERSRLELVLRQMPCGVILTEAPSGNLLMVNGQMEEICRQTFDGVKSISEFRDPGKQNLQVDFSGRETIDRLLLRSINDGQFVEGTEYRVRRADGTSGVVSVNSAPIRNHEGVIIAAVASFSDITERTEEEKFRDSQNRVLEMIAQGSELPEILKTLVQLVESRSEGLLGSILLLDEDGVHVRHGAAPGLPEQYIQAIDGSAIGANAGSCGTAMYLGKPVVITDILTDARWDGFRHLAAPLNLRACWSMPIISAAGKVLGSFALYYRESRGPTREDRRVISIAAHLAGIAIERQRAEEALRNSEARHRATLRAIPDLIFLLTGDGQYLDCHARSDDELMLPRKELIGRNMRDVLPPDLAERLAKVCRKVLDSDEPQASEYTLSMSERPRQYEARVVRAGEDRVLMVVRDITERTRAEEALRRSSEQIRELAGKLITAQEEERSRVSRELHDDLIQKVAAIAIGINILRRRIAEFPYSITQELDNLQRQTDMLADDIRHLSHQLHPAVLDHAGVLPALRSFTSEFSRLEGVEVNVTLPDCDEKISHDVGMCVYRIVQESLRNIAKHSGAKRADITLAIDSGEVLLSVRDDGRGFDVDSARGEGLGMISIEERVRLCQGRIQIFSQLNHGTTLSACIPLVPRTTETAH